MTDGSFLQLGYLYAGGKDPNNSVSVTSSNTAAVTVGNGSVTAVQEGDSELKLSAKVDGVDYSASVPIRVAQELQQDVVIDFSSYDGKDWKGITLENDIWQVDQDNTDSAMVSGSAILRFQGYGIDARPTAVNKKKDADLALKVKIPESGAYRLEIEHLVATSGNDVNVFVDETYVGTYYCYGSSATKTAALNSVYLTAGEHLVTFRKMNSRPQVFIGKLSFKARADMPFVEGAYAKAEPELIEVNETAQLTWGVRMTDGSFLQLGYAYEGGKDPNNTVSAAVRDSSIIKLNGNTLTGLAAGSGYVDVQAMVGGRQYRASAMLTVETESGPETAAITAPAAYTAVLGAESLIPLIGTIDNKRADFSRRGTAGAGRQSGGGGGRRA